MLVDAFGAGLSDGASGRRDFANVLANPDTPQSWRDDYLHGYGVGCEERAAASDRESADMYLPACNVTLGMRIRITDQRSGEVQGFSSDDFIWTIDVIEGNGNWHEMRVEGSTILTVLS